MKIFFALLAVLALIASVIGGLYVAFYLCLYGGILQSIQAVQDTPINAPHLALGIIRILATGIAGWLTCFVGVGVAGMLGALAAD